MILAGEEPGRFPPETLPPDSAEARAQERMRNAPVPEGVPGGPLEMARKHKILTDKLDKLIAEYPDPETKAESLPFVWAKDISDDESASQEIIEDILTAGAMSVWYGKSNSGKTYMVLDLGKAIAKGVPWLGRRTVQGAVIYVAAEGSKTIERRLRAIRTHDGELAADFPLGVVKTSIDMCRTGEPTEILAALVMRKAAEIGQSVTLVIIDTLSRVLAGGNENDSGDMGALVQNSDRLRDITGAHVLWIHHTGKDIAQGARGHSLLRAACDTEIEIIHDEASGMRTAKVSKQRDLGSHGLELNAKLHPVELGSNQWGNPITACVVIPAEGSPARNIGKTLKGGTLRAFKIAQELEKSGETTGGSSVIPAGKRLIRIDQWREKYRDSCGDMLDSSFRGAWSRSLAAMQDANRIGVHQNFAWIW